MNYCPSSTKWTTNVSKVHFIMSLIDVLGSVEFIDRKSAMLKIYVNHLYKLSVNLTWHLSKEQSIMRISRERRIFYRQKFLLIGTYLFHMTWKTFFMQLKHQASVRWLFFLWSYWLMKLWLKNLQRTKVHL